jgi:antitoxin HigA-1
MLLTKRKPVSVGQILIQEFMEPMGLTQAALAEAMGVQRKHVNELCNERRAVTASTALILARVFGNSPEFWLNVQRRSDLWEAMHSPRERERIERARPLTAAA